MKMRNIFGLTTGLIILSLAACNIQKQAPMPTQTPEPQPVTGVEYHFVTNRLLLPTTQAQTQDFALNIDGDQQGNADNMFGNLLNLILAAAPDLDMQSNLDQVITKGQVVSLHVVKADDPQNDPSVSWSIVQGQPAQSAPAFDGSDKFTVDLQAPVNLPIVGSLTNGHFAGGPGAARVQMSMLGQSVDVDLVGVRIEADLSEKGCVNGKLGGGITVEEFRGKLLPAIAEGLNQIVKLDNSAASILLKAFDADSNGSITTEELEKNPLLMIAISPDVDLLDGSGRFNPGQDGVKDSFSVGLGFTCAPATFTTTGE